MARVKTSIYVDKELWERFRQRASEKRVEASRLIEAMLDEEMVEDSIDELISELIGSESYEVDFGTIEPRGAPVSELVRAVRDERTSSLLGQQRHSEEVH